MAQRLLRHWKTLALTSAAIASTHWLGPPLDPSKAKRFFTLNAAEYVKTDFVFDRRAFVFFQERRNASVVWSRSQQKKKFDDDEEDDDDDEKESRDEEGKTDEQATNARERRFHQFASVEYDGEIYMVRRLELLSRFVSSRFSA